MAGRIISFLLLLGILAQPVRGANTITTNQLGQGVLYKHYHFDSLYNALEEVYVVDANLNDPAVSLKMPYLTGGATRTVAAGGRIRSRRWSCPCGG